MQVLTDIKENLLLKNYPKAFEILLKDRTTGSNIYWATDSYSDRGDGYSFFDEITIEKITGENGELLRPRASKSKEEQLSRTKDKAEVFTPAWVCNKQNNIVDSDWFGGNSPFNEEIDSEECHSWIVNTGKIPFPTQDGKTWRDYVNANRLEITCGEAPYLVSRYDTTTGNFLEVIQRIGLLDRKLRVVSENTPSEPNKRNFRIWRRWATKALQSTYGYEWQGDNLLLAREAIFCSFMEHYKEKWGRFPQPTAAEKIAEIISWNIWQMDGLTFGLPGYTPKEKLDINQIDLVLFKEIEEFQPKERYCRTMEWKKGEEPLQGSENIFAEVTKKTNKNK